MRGNCPASATKLQSLLFHFSVKLFLHSGIIAWVFLLCSAGTLSAQSLRGKVIQGNSPVPFASLHWKNQKDQCLSDSSGFFTLSFLQADTLIVAAPGFSEALVWVNDLSFREIVLTRAVELKTVEVYERQNSLSRLGTSTINTERLSGLELKKAACCNLAESFETNATVDVVMSDGISGARQLSMLGLDGVYTQINTENIPLTRGPMAAFGISYIPGTWIKSIDISKGTGSVVNGYEPLTGMINTEFHSPEKADRLQVNLYQNSLGRSEINFQVNGQQGTHFYQSLYIHGNTVVKKNDHNADGFMDLPLAKQGNIFYRAKWSSAKWMTQLLLRQLYDNKTGGQTGFSSGERMAGTFYGMETFTRTTDISTKTALLFPDKPSRGLGWLNNYRTTSQQLFFGKKNYACDYSSYQSRLIYQDFIHDTRNTFQTGLSLVYDSYKEKYLDSAFNRIDQVSGSFFEFTHHGNRGLTLMLGLRGDYHPVWKGWLTPKMNIKYRMSTKTTLHVTAGTGRRIANPYLDNTALFASSRVVIINEKLRPEEGITGGISLNHKTKILSIPSEFSFDYFETRFTSQVIADFYTAYNRVYLYNLKGTSYARSVQLDAHFLPFKNFQCRISYKWYDVISTFRGLRNSAGPRPMTPANRALLNLSYYTDFEKWKFDFTTRYLGKSRMPVNHFHQSALTYEDESLPYFILNTQVNRKFKHTEWYAGIENITGFTQPRAILSAETPFADTFDASMMYAPVTGRIFYLGFTWTIK